MARRFVDWYNDDTPGGKLVDLTEPGGWTDLRDAYTLGDPDEHEVSAAQHAEGGDPEDISVGGLPNLQPFDRVLEIAKLHDATTVVVEPRYIDLDFRSEHSHFYGSTFRRYPSVCDRLHFFTERPKDDLSDLALLQPAYLGYSIMRPVPSSPVGRTMLRPPPDMLGATVCLAPDTVHLFGTPLSIEAVPFVSQDAQYLRCAHAAVWMVLYHSYLYRGTPRRLPNDIHDAAIGGHVVARQVPSEGVSRAQMLNALQTLGVSAAHLKLPQDRHESATRRVRSLHGILCRYVNSHMPPIVHSNDHVWVIVGYTRTGRGEDGVRLFRHDDARGPYLPVGDPWNEELQVMRPWLATIAPLPEKVYLTGERAEILGRRRIISRARVLQDEELLRCIEQGDVMFRTYAVEATKFKEDVLGRVGPEIAELYRIFPWPRYVWVVEAIDGKLWEQGQSDVVVGEVVVDATADHISSSARAEAVLAVHVKGDAFAETSDRREPWGAKWPEFDPYRTGCKAFPDSPLRPTHDEGQSTVSSQL